VKKRERIYTMLYNQVRAPMIMHVDSHIARDLGARLDRHVTKTQIFWTLGVILRDELKGTITR